MIQGYTNYVLILVVYSGSLFIYFKVPGNSTPPQSFEITFEEARKEPGCPTVTESWVQAMLERNHLSMLMNEKLEKLGQLECQISRGESSVGGWCDSDALILAHLHDETLAHQIAQELKGKSIGSFGDGSGEYKRLVLSQDLVKSYDSYDGNPYSRTATNGVVNFLDLSVPQYWPPVYDWIMSLEVAEHIPAEFEQAYLDNLARHAHEGVIMSWAVIGQGGRAHINNRDDPYVRQQWMDRGFERDEEMSSRLKAAATLDWLKSNTNAYRRVRPLCLAHTGQTYISDWSTEHNSSIPLN